MTHQNVTKEACEVAAPTNKFPDMGKILSDFHAVDKETIDKCFSPYYRLLDT